MACADTKIEEARETVRRALQAADNGNQAGEEAVLAMAAAYDLLAALKWSFMGAGNIAHMSAAIAKASGQ